MAPCMSRRDAWESHWASDQEALCAQLGGSVNVLGW